MIRRLVAASFPTLCALDTTTNAWENIEHFNARTDKKWRFLGEPDAFVLRLPVSRFTARPQFRFEFPEWFSVSQQDGAMDRIDPLSVSPASFALWEILPEDGAATKAGSSGGGGKGDSKGGAFLTDCKRWESEVPPTDEQDKRRRFVHTLQPSGDLRSGPVYSLGLNDWFVPACLSLFEP